MKKIIFATIISFCFASCRKEYTCSDGSVHNKSSYEYEYIKKFGFYTDKNGRDVHCY